MIWTIFYTSMLRRADHACNDLIFREVKIPLPCTRRLNIPLNIDTTRPNIRGDCAHFGRPCHYDVEKRLYYSRAGHWYDHSSSCQPELSPHISRIVIWTLRRFRSSRFVYCSPDCLTGNALFIHCLKVLRNSWKSTVSWIVCWWRVSWYCTVHVISR